MKPLTILLRPSSSEHWAGGAIYFRNLVKSVLLAAEEEGRGGLEFVVAYDERGAVPAIDALLPRGAKRVFLSDYAEAALSPETKAKLRELPAGNERQRFRKALQFAEMVEDAGCDLVFPVFPHEEVRLPCPAVSWVPDLQHAHLPQFFNPGEIEARDRSYSAAARFADAVVLSSETARDDFVGRYGDPQGKLEVLRFFTLPEEAWFLGAPAETAASLSLPPSYFMVCNQFWAHKNHGAVLEALAVLKERELYPTVVYTGSLAEHRLAGVVDGFLQRACALGLWEQTRVLGMLARDAQIQLLRGARAVIQPSRFEGWSTVLEDCRAVGAKVIASDLPVHREQDLPGAEYFVPEDPVALADRIAAAMARTEEPVSIDEAHLLESAKRRALEFGSRFLSLARRLAR